MLSGFKTRKPWAAAVITFVFGPVAGMLYISRGWLAIAYLGGLLALMAACFAAAHFGITHFDPRTSSAIASWLLQIAGMAHAYMIAKNRGDEPRRWFSRWYSIALLCFILPAIVAFIFRHDFYEPFNVSSLSMQPALQPDDYIVVDKRAYKCIDCGLTPHFYLSDSSNDHLPQRGDVVVFKVSLGTNVVQYMKRIVGLPGDKIQVIKGTITINGKPLPRRDVTSADDTKLQFVETLPEGKEITLQEDKDTVSGANPNNYPEAEEKKTVYTVPPDQYFMIGDYLGHSSDSRNGLGFVGRPFITGKAIVAFWNAKTYRFSYRPVE